MVCQAKRWTYRQRTIHFIFRIYVHWPTGWHTRLLFCGSVCKREKLIHHHRRVRCKLKSSEEGQFGPPPHTEKRLFPLIKVFLQPITRLHISRLYKLLPYPVQASFVIRIFCPPINQFPRKPNKREKTFFQIDLDRLLSRQKLFMTRTALVSIPDSADGNGAV